MSSPPEPAPSEKTDTALAWAERRHAMLDRLAVLGMRLAEEVVERAVDSPYHPEPKHEPAKAFAQVSRTVRFTLVLQARAADQVIALRKGEPAPALVRERGVKQGLQPCAATDDDLADNDDSYDDAPRNESGRARENLTEREIYDELPELPFPECVAAIRADLALDPDPDPDPDPDQRVDDEDFRQSRENPNTSPPNPLIPKISGTQIISPGLAGGP